MVVPVFTELYVPTLSLLAPLARPLPRVLLGFVRLEPFNGGALSRVLSVPAGRAPHAVFHVAVNALLLYHQNIINREV